MTRTFRPGALGALMDEYERAVRDLAEIIAPLAQSEFEVLRDRETADEDCRSIRTVMNHVVRAGHGYVGYMRTALGQDFRVPSLRVETPEEALQGLAAVARATAETFEADWRMPDKVIESARLQSRWGPVFNLEQMFEHAIVHVLRHRRQIERYLTEPGFRPRS